MIIKYPIIGEMDVWKPLKKRMISKDRVKEAKQLQIDEYKNGYAVELVTKGENILMIYRKRLDKKGIYKRKVCLECV